MNSSVARAYDEIRSDIASCAAENGRAAEDIQLLAVSKTRSTEEMSAAYDAGSRHFGENYLQDALPKIQWFSDRLERFPQICWHFIGALQSNKTKEVAANFSWVHTVDREKLARRLANARPEHLPPLNVCVQINLHGEAQKAGVHPDALPDLLAFIAAQPQLAARGLMILPATHIEPRQAFDELAALFDKIGSSRKDLGLSGPGFTWDTLSMGMSGDYRAAIAAGSTMVRIGTALFGVRQT